MKTLPYFFLYVVIALPFSCERVDAQPFANIFARDTTRGLKDYYRDYFTMGVAVSPQALKGPEAALILRNFGSITPENVMKPGPIHPTENRYHWIDADSLVKFATDNHLKMRGHTLCWHQQTAGWFFTDAKGHQVTKDVLLERLKEHIATVVSRYKGKIYAWDVVNEAVADDSTKFLRDSPWFTICGDDFIVKAFEYAHAADPDALLYYNDYNTERPEKRERILRLLKLLKERNVPIHGIGLQGHWSIFEPSEQALRKSIEQFSALGLKIQITELDVSVYPWEKLRRDKRPDESDTFTPQRQQQQRDQYAMIFRVLRDYKSVITGVTFWNISDRHSWLDSYPVRGRKNYPLLFDEELQPKKAFWSVVRF